MFSKPPASRHLCNLDATPTKEIKTSTNGRQRTWCEEFVIGHGSAFADDRPSNTEHKTLDNCTEALENGKLNLICHMVDLSRFS
jgi:hypothetical protein